MKSNPKEFFTCQKVLHDLLTTFIKMRRIVADTGNKLLAISTYRSVYFTIHRAACEIMTMVGIVLDPVIF